ncbi:hypothetical protein L1987_49267 [Smallanthus sonchifolius]|uniref:Uncharacterized protein n=1 Tax=Smallanthus sonchifolius TaxID=185202 RepID=A0ACB9FU15_9ASTR|nr:hypothetical protein L1987_49267 [Smallanthus sonchifolius]
MTLLVPRYNSFLATFLSSTHKSFGGSWHSNVLALACHSCSPTCRILLCEIMPLDKGPPIWVPSFLGFAAYWPHSSLIPSLPAKSLMPLKLALLGECTPISAGIMASVPNTRLNGVLPWLVFSVVLIAQRTLGSSST